MLNEVIQGLQPSANQNFIDGTLGAGGHASAILSLTGPNGHLLGLDWDTKAIDRCQSLKKKYGDRAILVNRSYVEMDKVAREYDFTKVNGVLLDLGLSSDQLNEDGRGFSFKNNEPLDMRFSLKNKLTAEQIVNSWSGKELEKILFNFGEERDARSIVRGIIRERQANPIIYTQQLAEIVKKAKKPNYKSKIHPATKVFQALRIAVNSELDNIATGLQKAIDLLDSGGRLAVISFHSLEDRIVKDFIKNNAQGCICPPNIPVCRCHHVPRLKIITRKPIMAGEDEIINNPRARSAKLRIAEKI